MKKLTYFPFPTVFLKGTCTWNDILHLYSHSFLIILANTDLTLFLDVSISCSTTKWSETLIDMWNTGKIEIENVLYFPCHLSGRAAADSSKSWLSPAVQPDISPRWLSTIQMTFCRLQVTDTSVLQLAVNHETLITNGFSCCCEEQPADTSPPAGIFMQNENLSRAIITTLI